MADLLNFNPNRGLDFSPGRSLGFDPRRPLEFDSGRSLQFNMNRRLGFGHRGVVFRGFVCPICGALVTEDAKRCNECGAVFEDSARSSGPPERKTPGKASPARTPPKSSPPPTRTEASAVYCAYCGVKLKGSDAFCWNCGARASGSEETVKFPSKKAEPVTREWRGREER